ncbi:ATP-binding cassette domain-containing protein [Acetivibrio saccincola]|uniref:ATP-binding cassette domain-containing protein n=1 Tax=Acetivibrio saccincola TaxID=1677857 RepID=UPI000C6E61FD|nr:ATP-binding cassette domain-containing protein [Acetivibrio saccincola]HOA97407.1 ATP-binding cassette domain-containing protein [Acetivibrio saccincola]
MIKVKNLFKNYGRYNVLKGVNIEVREGEVYGFIGENGAGKSTTFRRAVFSSRPTGKKGCCGNNKVRCREWTLAHLLSFPKKRLWKTIQKTFFRLVL